MIVNNSNIRHESSSQALSTICNALSTASENNKMLWLLSGGSAIDLEVQISHQLTKVQKQHITIGQVDERYVKVGSVHHNWTSLIQAGLKPEQFDASLPMIQNNLSLKETAAAYDIQLRQAFARCTFSCGIYGIGTDGHTAGIKPAKDPESFKVFDSVSLTVGYQGNDYKRLTTTAAVITKLSAIYVYAVGSDKSQVLADLSETISPHKMPAQLLKKAKNIVIFS
jgi:6-phosphogluconolactonase/glucosamine-6-phosphate isomerase/deaminase